MSLHPFLNWIINKLNVKKYTTFIVISFIVFGFFGFFNLAPFLSQLGNFVLLYFIIGYIERYGSYITSSVWKLLTIFIVSSILFVTFVLLKQHYVFFDKYVFFNSIANFIMEGVSISLFYLFLKLKFSNKFINGWASLSLFIYAIHENIVFREITRPEILKYFMNNFPNVDPTVWVIALWLSLFIAASIAALIYKYSFHYLTNWLSKKLTSIFNKGIDKLISFGKKRLSKQN